MAKTPSNKNDNIKNGRFEGAFWNITHKLSSNVHSSDYKHIFLSLVFLRFLSDTFEAQRQKLIDTGFEKYVDMVQAYTKDNVFYLPEESRWDFIQKNTKQKDITLKVDTAFSTIEKYNRALTYALPDYYFSRLDLNASELSALIDLVNKIDIIDNPEENAVGRVCDYFLDKFAAREGKKGGSDFYTPKSVVNLIVEIIEPYKGKIYDPCCGSGGMFIQSIKFIESHNGNTKDVSIYGQEYNSANYKLAKMNLAIHGIYSDLGYVVANTFFKDQHEDLKADFIMANPPFN